MACICGPNLWRSSFISLVAWLTVAGPLFGEANVRQVTKLADGVYEIEHKDLGGGDSGNTTVIIGDREVFVVDSCYLPSAAREDIAQIRQWNGQTRGLPAQHSFS